MKPTRGKCSIRRPGGDVGPALSFDHEVGATEVLAPSFRAYFAAFADLEAAYYAPWEDWQGSEIGFA